MNQHLRLAILALGIFFHASSGSAHAADSKPKVWTPELQVQTRMPFSPRLSPDGKQILYSVSYPVMTADKSEYLTQIFLASSDGKQNVQLISWDKSSMNAKWSPDGHLFAYLSKKAGRGYEIFIRKIDDGETYQITNTKAGIIEFSWSPDGKHIAFVMSDVKSAEEEKRDKGFDDAYWLNEEFKMNRLYVLDVNQQSMTSGAQPRAITAGKSYISSDFDWSPDSRKIAFTTETTPETDSWKTSKISIVDIVNGNIEDLPSGHAVRSQPRYSPDGKWLAVLSHHLPARYPDAADLELISPDGKKLKRLPATQNADPMQVKWSVDGTRLFYQEAHGTRTATNYIDIPNNKLVALQNAEANLANLDVSADGEKIAFVMQTTASAAEVYVSSSKAYAPVQISHANTELALPAVGKTELIRWKSSDGEEIEGLLTYPDNYQPGQKVALLLNIHGGPDSFFSQTYLGGRGNFPLATYASHGYAILRANPRGSGAYGTQFRMRQLEIWGDLAYQDLMSGVDHVINMGVADADRLGVMGWSYGGYMTSWIISHTNRFKVAVAGSPVVNVLSASNTSAFRDLMPDYFSSRLWERPELYMERSPISHVKNVRTPTLIISGDADPVVSINQSKEFFYALKQLQVPTRMLVLPRQPHNPVEPKMSLATANANLEWIEKYLPAR